MSQSGVSAVCALCEAKARLEQSHIIPRFVYRGLQVPDGPKRALLCGGCEDLFSRHESTFARVVFHPRVADSVVVAKYEKWLLKFCASVCWRILEEQFAANPPGLTEGRGSARLASCRETWRRFLTGKLPGVGEHAIHLLSSDSIAGGEPVEMAVHGSDSEAFVSARLGPVILLGLISDPDRGQWRGTRVHLEGKIKPRETFVPARYRDYLSSGANPAPISRA
jgi:hypothetical protein